MLPNYLLIQLKGKIGDVFSLIGSFYEKSTLMVIVNIDKGLIKKNIYILIFIVFPEKHWYELYSNSLFARIIIIDT